jgi:uncharacterized protein (TIGR02147 family)
LGDHLQLRDIASDLNIFEFEDYRSYLSALYVAAKNRLPSYSYANLSSDLGLSSTNAFTVIQGKRNLTAKTAERIAEILRLGATRGRFLVALVQQEHARDKEARDNAFQERLQLAKRQLASKVDRAKLLFFENWYNSAILELLRLPDSKDDPQWIAATLRPSIGLPRVKASLKLLTELGYLAPVNGCLRPTTATISTGDEIERLAILSFHRQMIDLAIAAMDAVPADERDISALTFAVSEQTAKRIKDEVVAFRRRLIDLANADTTLEKILQLNVQLFPLIGKKDNT